MELYMNNVKKEKNHYMIIDFLKKN